MLGRVKQSGRMKEAEGRKIEIIAELSQRLDKIEKRLRVIEGNKPGPVIEDDKPKRGRPAKEYTNPYMTNSEEANDGE